MSRALAFLAALFVSTAAVAQGGDTLAAEAAVPFLLLGFAVGLAHALDADHVAAVAAMMGRGETRRDAIARGAAWGLGHTLALFLICSTALLLGLSISGTTEAALELVVGTMIVALGLRVFWKLRRERIHLHIHTHGDTRHIHAHSHQGDPDRHDVSLHRHDHKVKALLPTLGIGLVHGAAGSAGLLVLIVASADDLVQALLAFALFGIGSLIGMMLLTAVASYPLGYIHRGSAWMRTSLALSIGGLAVLIGGRVTYDSLQALGWLPL